MDKVWFIVFVLFVVSVVSVPLKDTNRARKGKNFYDDNILHPSSDCNCVCGMSDRQIRVVGGNVTKENEFPWLAGMAKNGEFHCGGTLITRKHVLTAAHCVDGINYRTISIAFGDHDRKDKERFSKIQVRKIKKVVPHKLFDRSTYNNDIAILELDHPLHFDSKIQPACLPHSAVTDYSGKWAIVAGWGKTGEKQESSTILRKAIVPIWPKKDCYNSGYGEERLSENMFCAGFEEGKIDACQGDSGGPLHVKNPNGIMDVVGIVSWGRGCGRATLPGIYTKIINYLDWILEGLNGECLCPPPPTSNQNLRRA